MKKIIQITPAISAEASGPSYSVSRLTETLINLGEDVDLVTIDWDNTPNFNFLKSFPIIGNKKIGLSPKLYKWLNKEALNFKGNLVFHNHGMWQMNAVYPGQIANKYKIPYIVSPRGTFSIKAFNSGSQIKKIFWPIFQKPSFKNVSIFHATSYNEYLEIRNMGFKQPVAIIPNGIDIPNLFEQTISVQKTLLYLGRINSIKGLDLLLPAWGKVQDKFPDWNLRIIGDDLGYHGSNGYKNKMELMAKKLKLKRVDFVGALYGNEKRQAYSDADLFILPTYSENFGVSVAEALASATPVIVTKGAPWADIEKYKVGKWVDINIDSLVIAMNDLMSLPQIDLKNMGKRGRDWMTNEFSWIQVSKKMGQLYQWLLEPNSKIPDSIILDDKI